MVTPLDVREFMEQHSAPPLARPVFRAGRKEDHRSPDAPRYGRGQKRANAKSDGRHYPILYGQGSKPLSPLRVHHRKSATGKAADSPLIDEQSHGEDRRHASPQEDHRLSG